jgi:hypothetical protein
MNAADVVGYVRGQDEICMFCAPKVIEACIDERIERLDAMAVEYSWELEVHDRDEIRKDLMEHEFYPIFASSEMDRYPVCEDCGEKIEDVTLTSDGLAYERRLDHEGLEMDEDNHVLTPEQQAYADQQGARMESRGLKFGIIYDLNLSHRDAGDIEYYRPWTRRSTDGWPRHTVDGPDRGIWTKTEGDSEYEYDYLEDDWIGGIHRKYVACLTSSQFKVFMDQTCLRFETENTMGSLGGPTPDEPSGGWSHQPAISFSDDGGESGVILSAYITPFWVGKHTPDDRDYDRIVEMLREKYS